MTNRPSHPRNVGTEHVGFPPTRQTSRHQARSAVRCAASRMNVELHLAGGGYSIFMHGRSRMTIRPWGGGGGGDSFVACLSHVTVDHASLSRRSTVPTANRKHLQHLCALSTFLPCFFHVTFYKILILSPPSMAVCGHHLSPRIAAVFSLRRGGEREKWLVGRCACVFFAVHSTRG